MKTASVSSIRAVDRNQDGFVPRRQHRQRSPKDRIPWDDEEEESESEPEAETPPGKPDRRERRRREQEEG